MSESADFRALAELDEEKLLALLYTEITGEEFGGDNFLAFGLYWSTSQRLTAVLWLSDNFDKIYQRLCVEWEYCAKRQDARLSDVASLAAAIADIIGTLSLGIPTPGTLATLLAKLGMDNFCGCKHGVHSRVWINSVVDKWEAKAADKGSGYYRAYYAWWWLAQRNFEEGKVADAQESFRRALLLGGEEARSDARLWNEYAWRLADAGMFDEAVDAGRHSVTITPEDAAHWDTLGRALLGKGEIVDAIEALENAVEYDRCSDSRWYGVAGQLEIRYHLVDAYVAYGWLDRAEVIVEDMVNLRPDGEWVYRARGLLSRPQDGDEHS